MLVLRGDLGSELILPQPGYTPRTRESRQTISRDEMGEDDSHWRKQKKEEEMEGLETQLHRTSAAANVVRLAFAFQFDAVFRWRPRNASGSGNRGASEGHGPHAQLLAVCRH